MIVRIKPLKWMINFRNFLQNCRSANMHKIIRSGRFYFWPIITANVVTMTLAIGGNPIQAAAFSIVISCLASFGFLLNDLWDREVDKEPDRKSTRLNSSHA